MKRTRPLHWAPPHTAPCGACEGSGRFRGLFHSGPCAACHGSGLVREDGEALPIADVAAVLRARLTDLEQRVRRMMSHPEIREVIDRKRQERERRRAEIGSRFD